MKTANSSSDPNDDKPDDKPVLLKAIELILAKPENIQKEAKYVFEKYRKLYKTDRTE
jgi:hypothetical protein